MPDQPIRGVEVARGHVRPEWIDVNNHMNVAYYVLVFDEGIDSLWERFGITSEYIAEYNNSTFAVESHITWQREIAEGEEYVVTTQILAYDEKRIHQFLRLYHAELGYLSATSEWMNLHVDLDVRRVAPWPDDILRNIAAFAGAQGEQRWPDEAGHRMRIERSLFSGAAKL
jgi:acyl-CoA thioester hydrolase